ncbi:DEAD-box type RNA helicase, partial [Exophiala xenobiotica]
MSMAEGRDLGIGSSDVVLLSKSKQPDRDSSEPHCLARVKEITRKKGEVQVVYRVSAAGNPLRPFLNDSATVYAVQVLSLTPLEREYGALKALQYYDLAEEIIRAKPSPILDYSDKELEPFKKTYNVNLAQAKAIKSALDNDAFTLIQGPPGSGKTKTICGLV